MIACFSLIRSIGDWSMRNRIFVFACLYSLLVLSIAFCSGCSSRDASTAAVTDTPPAAITGEPSASADSPPVQKDLPTEPATAEQTKAETADKPKDVQSE